jgi:hypothetical protein
LQDRLVKELRRGGATTLAEANTVLARYVPKFNRRFACAAVDPQSAYRPWPDGLRAERVFAFHYRRVVGADHTVAFDGLRLPIAPTSRRRSYARAKVDVYLHLDGRLTIHHQDQQLAAFDHDPRVPLRADTFVPARPIVYRPTEVVAPAESPPPSKPRPVTRPGPNHPWRKSYKGISSPKPVTFSQTNEGDISTG